MVVLQLLTLQLMPEKALKEKLKTFNFSDIARKLQIRLCTC